MSINIIDAGGMGKRDIELWEQTHPWIATKAAKKGPGSVDMGISILNADIRAGKLKFVRHSCRQLEDEMRLLCWDEDLKGLGRRKVKAGDPDHCADSLRYAYQRVYTHDTRDFNLLDEVEPGSREWMGRFIQGVREKALKPQKAGRSWLGIDLDFLGR